MSNGCAKDDSNAYFVWSCSFPSFFIFLQLYIKSISKKFVENTIFIYNQVSLFFVIYNFVYSWDISRENGNGKAYIIK